MTQVGGDVISQVTVSDMEGEEEEEGGNKSALLPRPFVFVLRTRLFVWQRENRGLLCAKTGKRSVGGRRGVKEDEIYLADHISCCAEH